MLSLIFYVGRDHNFVVVSESLKTCLVFGCFSSDIVS